MGTQGSYDWRPRLQREIIDFDCSTLNRQLDCNFLLSLHPPAFLDSRKFRGHGDLLQKQIARCELARMARCPTRTCSWLRVPLTKVTP
jgi:hypothetical protein